MASFLGALFFSTFYLFSHNQDGNSTQVYTVDWNGSAFLVTGNGLVSEPFPNFSFYENNYYIFYNLTPGTQFSIGENNQSVYSKHDVWYNGAQGNSEYLLFSPDLNSSRTLYYFNPEDNSSVGQISVLTSDSTSFYPQNKSLEAKFGKSIAINDWNQTIIGAPGENGLDGKVYIFDIEANGSLTQVQEIDNPDPQSEGQFGDAISTSGDMLAVSSPDSSSFAGSVYLFKRQLGGTYNFLQEAINLNNIPVTGDNFGWELASSGVHLAVTSLEANNSKSGKVSVFENNGSSWNFASTFTSDDNTSEDRFGYDLVLDDTTLLVGAPKADANGENSGAVYIFEKNETNWTQVAKIVPSDLSSGDEFGYSVALKGNLAFVGARQRDVDENITNAGVVYIFENDGNSWNEVSQIIPEGNTSNQYFSSDLVIYEDILGVSAPAHEQGFLYLYRIEDNGSTSSLISRLNLADANSTDQSHLSIILKEGIAVVGIPGGSIFEDAGGGALAFYNDGWNMKNLPNLPAIMDHNTSSNFVIMEDSGNFVYDFNGSHPYDSNLTWRLAKPVDGNASVNSSTGEFDFTPDGNFSGDVAFTVYLGNDSLEVSHDFNISVTEVNDAPVFQHQTLSLAMVGDDYNQTIQFLDDENDTLILSGTNLPPGLSIVGHNITGVPDPIGNDLYVDFNFTLTVSDSLLSNSKLFTLRVLQRNEAPQIFVDGNSSRHTIDITLDEDFDEDTWFAAVPQLDYNDSDGHSLILNHLISPLSGILDTNISAADTNESVKYTPVENFNGTDTFSIKLDENVTNPGGEANKSAVLVFNITINPVNDAPMIKSVPPDSPTSANEGVLFSYTIEVTDPELSDPDINESISITFENLPAWLSFDTNTSTLSGVPSWSDYEENGPRQIVTRVQDHQGLQDSQAFTLIVIPNNYPPVITEGASISASVDEDLFISDWNSWDLTAIEQDSILGVLTWSISKPPLRGTASVSGTGNTPSSFIYTPDGNFTGTDSFDLMVFDSGDVNASDTITININVLAQPDVPVFTSLTSGIAVKDYMFDYNITGYDADADANLSIINRVDLLSWLNFTDNNNGTARLWGTPDQYDIASNLILIEVRDETNLFSTQTFNLSVLEENNNPVIAQGSEITFIHTEDLLWDGSNLISATDEDGQFLEWSVLTPPPNGDLNASGFGYLPPVLNYMPDGNFSGTDFFTIQVSDGIDTDSITIYLEVQNVDDPPVFRPFGKTQQTIDNELFEFEIVFFDADGLSGSNVVLDSQSSWLTLLSVDYTSGKILLTGVPDVSNEGNNTFTLSVTDSTNLEVSSSLIIDVIVLNYPPEINSGSDSVTVPMIEDDHSSWNAPDLTADDNETASTGLIWGVYSQPSFGSATVSGTGASPTTLSYVPDGNFSGVDSFIVKVTDLGGIQNSASKSDTIIVYVEVTPVNDPPVFKSTPTTDRNGTYRWNDESSYVYDIKTFDADWNYSWHSLDLNVSTVLPEWLTFEDEGNGTGKLYGLASVADEGNYTISFHLTDSNQTDANQTFQLQIEVDNYPPVFESVSEGVQISELIVYIDEDSTLNGIRGWSEPTDYMAFDPDPTLPSAVPLSWSFEHSSSNGAEANASGIGERPSHFSYYPALNFYGLDVVNLKVYDGHRTSILPVRIKVRPVPDIPVFLPSPSSVLVAKEGANFNLNISTYDPDNSSRTIRVLGLPSGGNSWLKLIDHNSSRGTARLTGVPPSQSSGDYYQLAFVVTDKTGRFSVTNSELIVDGRNLRPVISPGARTTIRFDKKGNASPADSAKLFATDREGDELSWSLSYNYQPSFGFATVLGNRVKSPTIKYISYSSGVQDSFRVEVTDGTSTSEIEITAIVVDAFDSFDVDYPPPGKQIFSGNSYVDYFKVLSSNNASTLSMELLGGPSWLKVENVKNGLFKLSGKVPIDVSGVISLNLSFLEDGVIQKSIQHDLTITDLSIPRLDIVGSEFIQISLGESYTEPGYTFIAHDGTDISNEVQVTGTIDESQSSLQDLNYQVVNANGNLTELRRTVQVVDSNYTLTAKKVISLPSNPVKGITASSSGLLVTEELSSSESNFTKYNQYDNVSAPQYSIHFKAQALDLNNGIILKDGGYLISGVFRGGLEFRQNLVLSKGNHNLFVLKLDSSFNRVWFRTVSCSSELDNVRVVEMENQGIQLAGNFSGELFLESQSWNSLGSSDNFIWRMTANGVSQWLKTFGGEGLEEMVGLEPLPEGAFVTASNTSKSSEATYGTLVKFSTNGDILNGVSFSQTYNNRVSAIKYDNDYLYLTGEFEEEFNLDGKSLTTDQLSPTGFVLSLTNEFSVNWSLSMPSTGETDMVSVETDSFGYPVLLYSLDGNQSLDNDLLPHINMGQSDLILVKLDPSNGGILWQKPIATSGDDKAISLVMDKHGMLLVGVSIGSPFELDGHVIPAGGQFLIQLESTFWGSPLFQALDDLPLHEGHFFQEKIQAVSPSLVRMHLLESPSWMTFYDNKDGTAVLGGIPMGALPDKAKIRAYTTDGGFSDLDLNLTISVGGQSQVSAKSLPQYLSVINFGNDVSLSMTSSSLDGKYYVGASFTGSITLGGSNIKAMGVKDGFLARIEANGTVLNHIHLVSSGSLEIGAAVDTPSGDTFVMGHFSTQLRIDDFQVNGVGGSDLFIAHWADDGTVKNLSVLGGVSNETFTSAVHIEDNLYLSGLFEDIFTHDSHSVTSNGGKDGFVLQSSVHDISSVGWINSFGGSADEKVTKLRALGDGGLIVAGNFQNVGTFGSVTHNSLGMSDCFAGFLSSAGVWGNVFSFGGAGDDELSGLIVLADEKIMVSGNFMSSFKFGNREINSNGKRDGFVALFNEYGSCLFLKNYGGSGTDDIKSISHNDGQVHFVGSFSNQIALGAKNFSTRGVRDSYVALFDTGTKVVLDAMQLGGSGEDVAIHTDSAFLGNILYSGISNGVLDTDGSIVPTAASRNGYLALLVSMQDQNATIMPQLSPFPQTAIPPSTLYEYQFTTGPWPRGRDLSMDIIEKPAWLNIEMDEDGFGVVWGESPAVSGGTEQVVFNINSSLNGSVRCAWDIEIIASSKTISIIGDPSLELSIGSPYKADFMLSGESIENTLLYPVQFPSWLSLVREGNNHFSMKGTALEAGTYTVNVLAHKYIDENRSDQDELNFKITVQPKIIANSTSLNVGNWRTNWLGAFHAFNNSWSFHEDFAWVYFGASTQADDVWFWNEKWGWLWTSSSYWSSTYGEGFLYSSLSGEWMFFRRKEASTGLPSRVYSYEDKKWSSYD
ncbi:MAG: tandem-95 repeat protein [Opitutae bacterium]|nr:tandem-95 repeat protein [Opitutae bacterium]